MKTHQKFMFCLWSGRNIVLTLDIARLENYLMQEKFEN